MRNKERAQVWKYFHKEGEKSVVCGLCGQRLTFCSSTTTMRYHLERKHPMQWALGSNIRDISIDPLTGESLSTVVITEESDPSNPEAGPLGIPKQLMKRRAKNKKNRNDGALVNYNGIFAQTSGQSVSSDNSLMPLTSRPTTITLNSAKSTAITYFITEMLVRDLLPLAQVDSLGFKQLINYLEPTYTIPSRELIIQSLSRLYNEVKPNVAQSLGMVDSLSLTIEIWSSATCQLYATLTAYWVTDEWSLSSRVLSTSPLQVGYTSEDLGMRVHETLNDYGITHEKISAIVHSDTENWPTEIGGIPAVTCFAYTLQEAVKKALDLPPISRLVAAARKLVGSVKHLSGSIVELAMQKAEIKVSEINLEQDINSRWFTTCVMLRLLHEQRSVLCAVVGHDVIEKASDGVFGQNSEQWDLLGEIVCILHPLQTATEVISGEKNVSVSSVFPIFHGLTTVHLSDKSDDSPVSKLFKQIIRSEINTRWSLDSPEVVETVPVIASVLDPRYRDPLYLNLEQRTKIKDSLMNVIASYKPSSDGDKARSLMDPDNPNSILPTDVQLGGSPTKLNLSALEFLLGRHVVADLPNSNNGSDASEAELKLYMDPVMNPQAATDCNPFLWWQANRLRFPNLSFMAKRFLCVPSCSCPTDRIFTNQGLIINSSRAQLEAECVDYILFLNSNISPKNK